MKSILRAALIAVSVCLLIGCSANLYAGNVLPKQFPSIQAPTAPAVAAVTPTSAASPTAAPTETIRPTPTETSTPTPGPTATWMPQSASRVTAPILLYHHVSTVDPESRYVLSPRKFEQQIKALKEWGYTSIPITTLVDAVIHGRDLPARPVVITFDDGFEDVYQNAFPVMQRYGFAGTFYLIANQMGEYGTVTVDELSEMIAAGWEIGSHGMTHGDLTKNHATLWKEVAKSKIDLEEALHVPVKTFSYPYGRMDPTVEKAVKQYGYTAAVRLDVTSLHTWAMLYSLSRIEVRSTYDLQTFASFLPWTGAP